MFFSKVWRLRFSNFVNQQIEVGDVDVVIVRKGFDEDGLPRYEDPPLSYTNAGALTATTGTAVSDEYTNDGEGEGWIDADVHVKVNNANGGTGDFVVYYEASPDGANWPEAGQGKPIYYNRFTAVDADEKTVSVFTP